jgi:hypothetical protein
MASEGAGMTYRIKFYDPNGIEYALNDEVHSFLVPNGMMGFGKARSTAAATRIPYRDGVERLGGPYTPAREMEVAIEIMHTSLANWAAFNRNLQRGMSAYVDEDELGTLRVVTPDGLTRDIDCWVVEWGDPEMKGPVDGVVIPVFWAPSPWFRDPTAVSDSIGLPADTGFSIPLTVPVSLAATDVDGYINITNSGDVPTWPVIRITGPSDDPTIVNDTTGKTMAITQDLDAGDYIEIDMENATVQWYDLSADTTTNIIETISDGSEFWPLVRGNNSLHITAESAVGGAIIVTFYNLYEQGA